MATKTRSRILCVDDEPQVLEGLSLHLSRHYDVRTATSAMEALDVLKSDATIAVVLSDMRMPVMDGAKLLARARVLNPDTVRMLLTGQSDLDSAIAAVNEGQIFRFLTKPCPPSVLQMSVAAAIEQHELLTAQRVLLEQTVHGSIKMLMDVLGLVSPTSFGRATRIKRLVGDLARSLNIKDCWHVEVAAMLSQVGYITLPAETAEKVYYGRQLLPQEQGMVNRLPALTEQLLSNIPRLNAVRDVFAVYSKVGQPASPEPNVPGKLGVARGAQLLKVAIDFDVLESSEGNTTANAVDTMMSRHNLYDPEILQALVAVRGNRSALSVSRDVAMEQLSVGMVLAQDIALSSGALLVARGYEVTERFLERVRNLPAGSVHKGPVRVLVPSTDSAAGAIAAAKMAKPA